MCTVSIVPRPDGFRLACNRDERIDRPLALEPAEYRLGRRSAVFPVDPQSGGTWIGCNDAGVTAVILNRSSETAVCAAASTISRGSIVPAVLACSSWAETIECALALNPRVFDPFRLVIVNRRVAAVLSSNRERLSLKLTFLAQPIVFTSSSLGDRLVDGPRRRLFESLMRSAL